MSNNIERKPYMVAERSGVVEMEYFVSCVVMQDGVVIWSVGNENSIVPLRSAAKPFMLCPLLDSAKASNQSLSAAQIAIATSSHNGEPCHRDAVRSILDLAHSSLSDLHCGTHQPYYEWIFSDYYSTSDIYERQLFHNCSGKHAGMLLLCHLLGASKQDYWQKNHQVQLMIAESVRSWFVDDIDGYFSVGIDGCGVPTYNVKLLQLANAYCKLATQDQLINIKEAILAEPYLIAGKERIDTVLIESTGYIAKSGSDGLFCMSCPSQEIGIALKVESGCEDASEAAIIDVLNRLGLLSKEQFILLSDYWRNPILTTTSTSVGGYKFLYQ